jgi:hypothetical protein
MYGLKTTHIITLESEGDSSIAKFNIQDAYGNTLWSGITLYGPYETHLGNWSGLPLKSLSSIVQKLWLVEKIKADRIVGKNAIHFSLNIDAQYKLPLDTDKHELSDHSELSVMLWREQEAKEETQGNDQKETHSGRSQAASWTTVDGLCLGQGKTAGMVEGTLPAQSKGLAAGCGSGSR